MMPMLVCTALFVQPANETIPVRGKVLDSATSLPVAGARVIMARSDRAGGPSLRAALETQPAAGDPDPRADRVAVLTGADGTFSFALETPVHFYLYADAAGYVLPFMGIGPENTFEIKRGGSIPDILVRMTPAQSISGRIIDEETGSPAVGLSVRARAYRQAGPGRSLAVAGAARTGEDGRFVILRLAPGDYYIEAHPTLGQPITEAKPGPGFQSDVLFNYAPSWHPGVERFEECLPVKLWDGAAVQDMEMKIRKKRIARLRGRIRGIEEAEGSGEASLAVVRVDHTALGKAQTFIARGTVKLATEFQIDGVPPGDYWLSATAGGPAPAERQCAIRAINVGDTNQQGLDLFLSKGTTVTGIVRLQDQSGPKQSAPPLDNLRVVLRPLLSLLPEAGVLAGNVRGADGAFAIGGFHPDKYYVQVLGQLGGLGIAEVRYNGANAHHGVIEYGAAIEQKLEIILAPAAASISVSATAGVRPAAGAAVLAVREPITPDFLAYSAFVLREAKTNSGGQAVITGLLPGRYRLTAYPQGALWADDPHLTRRLASGDLVIVEAARTATAQLRVEAAR
jgi:hypothetical protein